MTTHQDLQINEYTLIILYVKMKVKFPCKMKLEHSTNTVTEQVEATEQSKFLFNQQLTIQQPATQSTIDFNAILVTEKGSKYVSGVMRLASTDLQKTEGQKIITPLTKCLDNQAYCQLKVIKTKIGKVPKRVSVSSTLIELKKLNSDNNSSSAKQQKGLLSPNNRKANGVETRSQIGFSGLGVRKTHQWDDTRSKGGAHTLIYKSSFLKSPKSKKPIEMRSPKSRQTTEFNQQYQVSSQRQRLSNADSEVYRQGYQKLKQKYKSQAQTLNCQLSKRQQLQANQNNYKVQIMRLKLKTQEQQRIITQKNQKINQLQIVISQINKQDLDITFLKEENKNLQDKIDMMNDVIHGLKKDYQNIKNLYEDKQTNYNQITNELRQQLESAKHKLQSHSLQTAQTIRQKTQQILSLTTQLKSKSHQIQLQLSEIQKLQTHTQTKIYEFEQTLQLQKNANSQAANQFKQKIQLLQRDKKLLETQVSQIKNDKEKIKNLILKAEYDKKVLHQDQNTLKAELLEYKTLKEKHNQLQRQFSLLSEDNTHLRKQLQLQSTSKQINLQQINQQHQLQLNYYKKQSKEFQEKHKLLSSRRIQLETQLQLANNTIEKQKRLLESNQNQLNSLKTTLKQTKHYTGQLEQQKLNLQNQLAITNNKLKFSQQTTLTQIQKIRSDLQRTRNQLAAETSRTTLLSESKYNLQTELNKNKIQLHYHQDKIDKLFNTNKQHQATIEHITKEHETQLNDLQQELLKTQNHLKTSQETLHKHELQKMFLLQKLQTNKKQLKLSEEKISHLQNQLKSRLEEITNIQHKHRTLEKTLSSLQNQHSALKHDYTVLKNQRNKTQKISQLKSQQIMQLRKELETLEQDRLSLEKQQLQLRDQLKKNHQNHIKLQLKLKSLDRQYNKFKQLIHRTVKTQYAKLPLLNHHHEVKQQAQQVQRFNQDSKLTVILNGSAKQIEVTPQQVLLQTLSTSSILSHLTTHISDTKTTLFKLIQHNKQLKKQINSLRQQSEQSSNKYQFTEIQLHRELQEVQEQLNHLYEQKQEQIINYDRLVSQLNSKLHDKDNLCEQLTQQVEQLQYAISSLKLEFETNSTKNDKKVLLLKKSINQLEDKIQFYKVSLSNQQDRNHELQEKAEILKAQKDELIQSTLKNKLSFEQLSNNKQKLEQQLGEITNHRKVILQKLNQTQIELGEQKALRQKADIFLEQQEKKTLELKQFVSTLMKQKENIIRSELEKSDKILELETQQLQLTQDLQLAAEQTQRIKSQLQQNKEKLRKQTLQSRNLQQQLCQSTSKCKKLNQKLQQKQKQIQMKDQIINRLNKKYKELTQKNYKQTLDLHSQIDHKYIENINLTSQLNQNILLLQAKIEELQHIKAKQHHENILINDQLLTQKQHCSSLQRQNHKLESQLQEIHDEFKSLENRNQQLTQQIQLREQQLSHLNQKLILLQAELQALAKDNHIQLEQTNLNWTRKYQSLIHEHQHLVSLLQNKRQMIRSQLQQKINELQLSNTQNKHSELGINDIKQNYQQKIKKLENDRLQTTLAKNNQIKKLTEQNKLLSQNLINLESAQKQNSQLLENIRKRLLNQEKLRKDNQEKYKTHKKLHQAQLNTLLSKQAKLKTQIQQLYQSFWSNERQVRKVLQNYLKRVLDQCDSLHIDKITNSTKGLQSQVVKAMTNSISPSSNFSA